MSRATRGSRALALSPETGDNRMMVRASLLCVVIAAVFAPASADADVFKLFGQIDGGGMGGKGLAGDQKEEAFHPNAPHAMYGASVGARFLIVHGMIQHHQYAFAKSSDSGASLATWTQFMAGISLAMDIGSAPPVPKGEKAKKPSGYFEVGASLGFGIGTGQQVDPPLSNDEVTDKGFVLEGRIGFGKRLNKIFDIGLAVPVTWGYYFKNGVDQTANDVSTHYRSLHVEGLIYLRANLKLF